MTKVLDASRSTAGGRRAGRAGLVLLAWGLVPAAGAVPLHLAQAPSLTQADHAGQPAQVPPPSSGSVSRPPGPSGTPATVIDGQQVESLLGKQVQSNTGEDMGHIADIIVDKSGAMRAAVIDFGGFLGVGSRKIAVDWSALHFTGNGKSDHVTVDISRNDLRVAPTYKEGEQVVVLGRPAAAKPDPAPPAAPDASPAN